MQPLQAISLNNTEYNQLENYYINDQVHDTRQSCHVILLWSKGFSIREIEIALSLKQNYVVFLIKAWFHFKFAGLFTDDIESTWKEILKLETPPIVEKESFWENLWKGLVRVIIFPYHLILRLISVFIGLISRVITVLGKFDIKKHYLKTKVNAANILHIAKDSSHNVIFQFININSDNKEKKTTEEFKVSSLGETKEKFEELFNSGVEIISKSQVVALFFAVNDRIQQIQDEERRKRILSVLVTISATYIYYHTTIKGGVVLVTIFGASITVINIKSCLSDVSTMPPITNESSSLLKDSLTKKDTSKNITSKKDSTSLAKVEDELEEEIMPSYSPKEDCNDLTEITTKQQKYINQDSTIYYSKDFYIREPDNKMYLHVAAYSDIKSAAFQRAYLIEEGYSECKILKIPKKNGSIIYAVTIGDFVSNDVLDLCELKEEWDDYCDSPKGKAKLRYNR